MIHSNSVTAPLCTRPLLVGMYIYTHPMDRKFITSHVRCNERWSSGSRSLLMTWSRSLRDLLCKTNYVCIPFIPYARITIMDACALSDPNSMGVCFAPKSDIQPSLTIWRQRYHPSFEPVKNPRKRIIVIVQWWRRGAHPAILHGVSHKGEKARYQGHKRPFRKGRL